MSPKDDSWVEWKRYILENLTEIKSTLKMVVRRLNNLELEVGIQKTKIVFIVSCCTCIGALIGSALGAVLVSFLKSKW